MNGDRFLEARVQQLKSFYHVYGKQGLAEMDIGDLRLLRSAKLLELDRVSKRLEGREGGELDRQLKAQIESHLQEIGMADIGNIKAIGQRIER